MQDLNPGLSSSEPALLPGSCREFDGCVLHVEQTRARGEAVRRPVRRGDKPSQRQGAEDAN